MESASLPLPSSPPPPPRLEEAIALAQRGALPAAISILQALAAERPRDPLVCHNLAVALGEAGQPRASAQAWEHLVTLSPAETAADAWIGAGLAWMAVGAPHPALRALQASLHLNPRRPGVRARVGTLLLDIGDYSGAEAEFTAAFAERPGLRLARVGLARLRLRRRDVEGAAEMLAPLLETCPQDTEVAALYSELCLRERRPEAALPVLRAALQVARSPASQGLLLHRIADVFDELGAWDAAMDAWDTANTLERKVFRPADHAAGLQALGEAYTSPRQPLARASTEDALPVFIVGMPRSGTSLLEQMLDRHPLIRGLGEREEIRQLAAALPEHLGVSGDYFHHLDRLTPAVLDPLAAHHRQHLRALAGADATRVIDKMPHNFLHLGLIGQLLPGARALHCVRDPVDTCFSCYRQRFSAGLPYTTHLGWLGAFYRGYTALMAVWVQVQPLPIMEVRYEDLVADPEPVLRQVLAFLGLPWHPDCLQFHRSQRDVSTASHAQVQRPLYTSSVGRASPYAHRLGALRAALDGLPEQAILPPR